MPQRGSPKLRRHSTRAPKAAAHPSRSPPDPTQPNPTPTPQNSPAHPTPLPPRSQTRSSRTARAASPKGRKEVTTKCHSVAHLSYAWKTHNTRARTTKALAGQHTKQPGDQHKGGNGTRQTNSRGGSPHKERKQNKRTRLGRHCSSWLRGAPVAAAAAAEAGGLQGLGPGAACQGRGGGRTRRCAGRQRSTARCWHPSGC